MQVPRVAVDLAGQGLGGNSRGPALAGPTARRLVPAPAPEPGEVPKGVAAAPPAGP